MYLTDEILKLDKKLQSGQWDYIRKGVLAHELGHLVGKCTSYLAKKYQEIPKLKRHYEYEADQIAASLSDIGVGKGLVIDLQTDKESLFEDTETSSHPTLASRIERLQEILSQRSSG